MSDHASTCPHDLGPGTTVCLRCRLAEREASRARQQRLAGVGAAVIIVVGLLGGAAVGAARGGRKTAAASEREVTQQGQAVSTAIQGDSLSPSSGPESPALPDSRRAEPSASPSRRVKARAAASSTSGVLPTLVISPGHSPLAGGLSVDRTGDEALVSFDTPETRTRRRDKVEQVVRATLPTLYGAIADSALARIPAGTMSEGDLLTDVVPKGIRIPLATGAIVLALETRPGQDGPLVVRYRARMVRQ